MFQALLPAGSGIAQGVGKLGLSNVLGGSGKSAAKKAKKAERRAAYKALKFQKEQYEQQKALQKPFIEGGTRAFGMQGALTGLQGAEAQQAAQAQYQQTLQPAIQAGLQGALPSGMPNVGEALGQYVGNVAAQDYDNYYNRLGGMAGMGQASASALGGVGADSAAGIANTMQYQSDSITNAALARQQAQMAGISSLMQLGGAGIGAMGNSSQASKLGYQTQPSTNKPTQYSNSFQ